MSDSNRKNEVEGSTEVDDSNQNVLDLSNKGVTKMGHSPKKSSKVVKLILDHNSITKIENLEAFPQLSSLSTVGNHLLRMNGVNFGKNLTSLNLLNNGIVSMEGLCWLVHLEYLDLSKNNIKRIQNVSYCTKLQYMDLSENSISDISDLSSLVNLKVFLLRENTVTNLERTEVNLPGELETFSIANNGVSDLNQMHHLVNLRKIENISVLSNPCVTETASISGFNYRPFVLFCCPTLLSIDGVEVKDSERVDAEKLRSDENLRCFTFGHHIQLILYLSTVCPITSDLQLHEDQKKFLESFLEKQKLHKSVPKSQISNITSKHNTGTRTPGPYGGDQNSLGTALDDNDEVDDLLRSESSFLPVYSPLKKSMDYNDRSFRSDFDHSESWGTNSLTTEIRNADSPTTTEDFPIMTEEEANKLIHLAATILQAHIRGFLVRRTFNYRLYKRNHNAARKIQALWKGYYFRHLSEEGRSLRDELRIARLQKYVVTLYITMKNGERQQEQEKQQLSEAVIILYEKLTRLSDLVEEQNIRNKIEQDRRERKAAVVLQKRWRGYIARKNFFTLKPTTNLESLYSSHILLVKKVQYLESLLLKHEKDKSERDVHLDAVFLPHPRHKSTNQQVEKMRDRTGDGNDNQYFVEQGSATKDSTRDEIYGINDNIKNEMGTGVPLAKRDGKIGGDQENVDQSVDTEVTHADTLGNVGDSDGSEGSLLDTDTDVSGIEINEEKNNDVMDTAETMVNRDEDMLSTPNVKNEKHDHSSSDASYSVLEGNTDGHEERSEKIDDRCDHLRASGDEKETKILPNVELNITTSGGSVNFMTPEANGGSGSYLDSLGEYGKQGKQGGTVGGQDMDSLQPDDNGPAGTAVDQVETMDPEEAENNDGNLNMKVYDGQELRTGTEQDNISETGSVEDLAAHSDIQKADVEVYFDAESESSMEGDPGVELNTGDGVVIAGATRLEDVRNDMQETDAVTNLYTDKCTVGCGVEDTPIIPAAERGNTLVSDTNVKSAQTTDSTGDTSAESSEPVENLSESYEGTSKLNITSHEKDTGDEPYTHTEDEGTLKAAQIPSCSHVGNVESDAQGVELDKGTEGSIESLKMATNSNTGTGDDDLINGKLRLAPRTENTQSPVLRFTMPEVSSSSFHEEQLASTTVATEIVASTAIPETDVKVSPRLGQRASSLLSALKTELTSVTSSSSSHVEHLPPSTSFDSAGNTEHDSGSSSQNV